MLIRILVSFFIFAIICVPIIIISVPVVGVMLLTKWDGRSTIFGNSKWGRANNHFAYPTKNYWEEFIWLVYRNPVNNLMTNNLAVSQRAYILKGDAYIGDKQKGGFYTVKMGRAWEYYWIKPYTIFGIKKCIRVRIGWKIYKNTNSTAQFVFVPNPIMTYRGV